MNISWSKRILELLHQEGVRDVVSCAGARNSPLVSVLAHLDGFNLQPFFEERSAAFFAMGAARRSGQPTAVITTSGTAAAELLPAVVESFHTGVPLIVVTADRPRRLRGTGAPQSIDQTGLFAKFVSYEFDLENGEEFSLQEWNRRSPVHINICFDEPLIDEPLTTLQLSAATAKPAYSGASNFSLSTGSEWASLRLTKFLKSAQVVDDSAASASSPLVVIVGTLETQYEREAVCEFLLKLGAPVYLEGPSGLRERVELRQLALRSGDRILNWALKRGLMTRVLRIGGIPTVRVWRDLEERTCPAEVLSLTPLPFSGLSRGEMICAEIASVLKSVQGTVTGCHSASVLFDKDRGAEAALQEFLRQEPCSEPALFHELSKQIADSSLVYIGNSLPIREWDLAADRSRVFPVEANRGVNGIDGQISTFIGLARENQDNWAVLGDLTTLYDLTGPWAAAYRQGARLRLVVMNNGGGKIFSRLFANPLFENNHTLGFEYWAKMWNLNYQRWTEIPSTFVGSTFDVIEIVPDLDASKRFWDLYDALWK